MVIAAVLCLCGAAVSAALGTRALTWGAPADGTRRVRRAVAPTQLAAAVMLTAGGVVALAGRGLAGLVVLCVLGAVATAAAGVWRGARYAQAAADRRVLTCARSGQACPTCMFSCR